MFDRYDVGSWEGTEDICGSKSDFSATLLVCGRIGVDKLFSSATLCELSQAKKFD